MFISLLFLLTLFSCKKEKKVVNGLRYAITYNTNIKPSLDVEFSYKTNEKGLLILDFLNNSSGDNAIFNCIKNFKIKNVKAYVSFVRDSNFIKIESVPNKELQISYSIVQDFKAPFYNHHRYRPIITKEYFHVLGVRLFVVPTEIFKTEKDSTTIDVTWKGIPEDGIIQSSFGITKDQTFTVNQEKLYGSYIGGGDFRRYQFNYLNKPVYFVTRGTWESFSDVEVFNILKETVTFQNKFWNDTIDEMFSVSLLPTEEKNSYSIGGSGFSNSFISFASNNKFTGLEKLSWLYNHELLHKWILRTIKNENDVEQYWFSEGFTDYYAHKLLLKNNKSSLEEFISSLNTVLKSHHHDKLNSIPNSQITFNNYWGNYALYQKLPYRRGLLYAFLIDSKIKMKYNFKKSLDDLMKELLELAKSDVDMRLNNKVFKKMLSKYLDIEAISEFERYILNGELIDFNVSLRNGLGFKSFNGVPQFILHKQSNKEQIRRQLKI